MAALAEFDPGSSSERLLELIGDTHGVLDIDEFRWELLLAVRRAVPADWISLNDIGPEPDTMVGIVEPQIGPTERDLFARYAHENPLVERYARTHDGRVRRFSDVTTSERLHALNIYTEFYKPLGIEYQLAFTLPHRPERILGVALSRSSHDFTDAECALLERARPFLIQSYRNAILCSELQATHPTSATARGPDLDRLITLGLTNRQAQVLRLVATGAAEHEIAAHLNISYRTVQKHLEHCYRRLGVNSRSQAAGIAWSTAGTSYSIRRDSLA
jgi:DNA-binding CsgD family transcriptional regulator